MRVVPWICAAAASTSLLSIAWADGEGLTTKAERVAWPRIEARVLPLGAPSWRSELAPYERSGLKLGGLGVLGDVYFGPNPARSSTGGFRATSGLIVGGRASGRVASAGGLSAADRRHSGATTNATGAELGIDGATVPYLGLGYSNAWPKSGWRISADLGLVSLSPGGASGIGRVLGGSQSLDDLVRDMRLAPVVQLGVSYSF